MAAKLKEPRSISKDKKKKKTKVRTSKDHKMLSSDDDGGQLEVNFDKLRMQDTHGTIHNVLSGEESFAGTTNDYRPMPKLNLNQGFATDENFN